MGQRIIGLTGGIATGKSTVSSYLQQRQIPVLDADLFAREAVAPGSKILRAITQRYGAEILDDAGNLRRQRLGAVIFSDGGEKTWVEQQIHPFVRQRFGEEMARLADAPIVVHAIPLLFEADLTEQVTEIWVVACAKAIQLQRLMHRDRLSQDAAEARIHNQWPLAEKIRRADVVLHNDTTRSALYEQVDRYLTRR